MIIQVFKGFAKKVVLFGPRPLSWMFNQKTKKSIRNLNQ